MEKWSIAGAEVFVRRGQLMIRPVTPAPALSRGLVLHPDDPKDPDVFRIDLSGLGIATGRVVFSRSPDGEATAFHLDIAPVLSFDKRPATNNPRLWASGGLGLAVAATATAARRRRGTRHPGGAAVSVRTLPGRATVGGGDPAAGAQRSLRGQGEHRPGRHAGDSRNRGVRGCAAGDRRRVNKHVLRAALTGESVLVGQRLARRYRLDRDAAYARPAAVDRTTVMTRFGTVEYAERGSGEPLLVIHGFFGGCDEALLSLRGLTAGRRVIAPSRFGYLGSSMPADATVAAQADAFAALLDGLSIDRLDVAAISSGATSAFRFALRHPDRVKHLAVICGNMPEGAAVVAPPQAARLVFRDVPMRALKVFARPVLLRQAAGSGARPSLSPAARQPGMPKMSSSENSSLSA